MYLIGVIHLFVGRIIGAPVMLIVSILAQMLLFLRLKLGGSGGQVAATEQPKQTRDTIFSVLITGASSGIGKALVLDYAKSPPPSHKSLCFGLLGTRSEALEQLSIQLTREYNIPEDQIFWQAIDVRDEQAMSHFIKEFEFRFEGLPDVLVANAGVVEYTLRRDNANMLVGDMHKRIWDINFEGMLNTVIPVVNDLLVVEKDKGSSSSVSTAKTRSKRPIRIGIVSAMASIIPSTSFYALCKKAMVDYTNYLRWILLDKATVTAIIPGFVDTEMVEAYKGSKPMMVSAAVAARYMRHSIERGDSECTFPVLHSLLLKIFSSLPPILSEPIMTLIPYSKV